MGALLRQSRLRLMDEIDWNDVEMLTMVMDQCLAEQNAQRKRVAVLVVPDDIGSYEYAAESYDDIFRALNCALKGELDELRLEEVDEGELAAADPDGEVQPCTLNDLWYRPKSERKIAAALEAASVSLVPNATCGPA